MLIAGAVSGLSSGLHFAGMKQIAHTLTWGFNLAVLSNMAQFLFKKCSTHPIRKHRSHFAKFAPAYLAVLATVLVMVDLTRHVVNDAFSSVCLTAKTLQRDSNDVSPALYQAFKTQTSFEKLCYDVPMLDMYVDGDDCWEYFLFGNCLSTYGWIGFLCTWVGFICLFVGVFWGIDMHRKLRMQWRRARGRGGQARDASTGGAAAPSSTAERNAPLLETA